ncbi:MAG: MaoC/PaaZ C-terminal domain-containing protein [Acidobacteriota bacterium]
MLDLEVSAESSALLRAFEEIREGDRCRERVVLGEDAFAAFLRVSGDAAPVHTSRERAREMGYPDRILPGLLASLRFSRLLGMYLPGPHAVIHTARFEFRAAVLLDSEIDYSVIVSRLIEPMRAVVLDLVARCGPEVVIRGTAQCVMKR